MPIEVSVDLRRPIKLGRSNGRCTSDIKAQTSSIGGRCLGLLKYQGSRVKIGSSSQFKYLVPKGSDDK